MDELQLSETFQRYFSDIFLCCDEDKSGKASLYRTTELVKSGNIPDDIIAQVIPCVRYFDLFTNSFHIFIFPSHISSLVSKSNPGLLTVYCMFRF